VAAQLAERKFSLKLPYQLNFFTKYSKVATDLKAQKPNIRLKISECKKVVKKVAKFFGNFAMIKSSQLLQKVAKMVINP
jgi:hypothetical protein